MFEQSLFNEEAVAPAPLNAGDLFYNYEIKPWEMSPRLYKILVFSAIGNILAILIVAQTSLLTMKGCDSPLVGRVCSVLDTVYVGSMIFGTDREYVDAVYEKTELGDAEVTFVDVSGETPPLSYPEGYFQIANPNEFAMMQQQSMDPGFGFPTDGGIPPPMPVTPSPGTSLLDTQPNIPPSNPSVVQGQLPSFGGSGGANKRKGGRGGRVNANIPDEDDTAAVKPTPSPETAPTPLSSDAVTALEINKKPLTDFVDQVQTQIDAKTLDLNQPFMIVLNGVLTKDGKLDREKSKFDTTKQKGDQKMIDIAKSGIEAIGDSGFLTYLRSLDVDKVTMTLVQDDTQVVAIVSSGQKTPERANYVATSLNNYISFGKIAVKNPSDERTLLDGAKVTSDGKNFILNFVLPKPVAQEMITRKLKEQQAKKAQQNQPSGNANVRSENNTAEK